MNFKLRRLVVIFLASLSVMTNASPWIDTDEYWVRADIELLASQGAINIPITTWPMTWADLDRALESVSVTSLSGPTLDAYSRLSTKSRANLSKGFSKQASLYLSNNPQIFRHFGDRGRNEQEVSAGLDYLGDNLYVNLEPTLIADPVDGDDVRFDGSQISGIFGNWIVGAGYVERWWGPGWDSSLILSNNARARPGLFVQRNYSTAFDTPWLSWIGPWQFTSFMEVLDDERFINDAKLFGMSVSFKPFKSLEIGLRRTAQWGGDGRVESFDSFWRMLIGDDNCQIDQTNQCLDRSQEAGNQLAAIDLKWTIPTIYPLLFYLQTVGEDESNYLPAKKSFLGGASFNFPISGRNLTVGLEFQDTTTRGEQHHNLLYEHSIYRVGYRYNGRVIGSTLDNDSQSTSLQMTYHGAEYGIFFLAVKAIKLNQDGSSSPYQTHTITENAEDFSHYLFGWRSRTKTFGEIEIKLNVLTGPIDDLITTRDEFQVDFAWRLVGFK